MKKQIKNTALAAVALLSIAGAANAAETIDLNIYGASAQYTYWNAAAPTFLQTIRGCSSTHQTAVGSKDEITTGYGCDGANNTINIRYSSKASYDGIYAVSNQPDATTTTQLCTTLGERPMVAADLATTTTCLPVHLGASDVAGETFTQTSHGMLLGPVSPAGTAQTNRVFSGVNTAGLTAYRPIVVPFGFFANNAIKVYSCVGGAHDGNACTTSTATADCGTGTCTQNTISNITREQVVQIFSGNAYYWSDFGANYSVVGGPQDIVACLRHAGSGTHATFDKVFFTGANPNGVAQNESRNGSPTIYFNDGSTDEIKCVNGNTPTATGSAIGGIGYADADQGVGVAGTSQNVVAIKYNGLFGRRNTIRNGAYDFFTNEWLYENPNKTPSTGTTAGAKTHTLITQLVNFASNPDNLTNATAASLKAKAAYWGTQNEMVFNKDTDSTYPIYKQAGTQTP